MRRRVKVTRGGQISLPATIRHRWGTGAVSLEDHGDHVVLRPVADDPIAAAEGAFAGRVRRVDLAELRTSARAADEAASARRPR